MSPVDEPETVYLIAGTPRTGTTLLCQALTAAAAGQPDEWFSRANLATAGLSHLASPRNADRGRAVEACRGYLVDRLRRTCRNGVSGVKLHWHQLAQLQRAGTSGAIDDLLAGRLLPARVRAVLVTRSPVDAQAVSVLRAYASGVFAVGAAGQRTILRYDDAFWGPPGVAAAARARLAAGDVYDYADLGRICAAIEQANGRWRDYLRAAAVPTRQVSYDDLCTGLVPCANAILADLAVPGLRPGYRPGLVVQRDSVSTAMLYRYRADAGLAARHDERAGEKAGGR